MIYRTNKQIKGNNGKVKNPHTEIDNRSIDDYNISNGALGLLVRILRNIETWEFDEESLAQKTNTGISKLRTQLGELIKCGYVYRERYYDKGRFKKYIYSIYEFPSDFQNNNKLNNIF